MGVSAAASASGVGTTSLVSLRDPSIDFSADRNRQRPAISADGNIIAYHFYATNLVSGDTNGTSDVFVTVLPGPVAEDLAIETAENTPVGSVIGTVSATDNDGDVLSFSITAGNGSGLFSIDNNGVTPLTDTSGSVFENDIEWLATTGITRGCNPPVNDQFCPTGHVTKGQMAAFLHRALG